MATPGMSTKAQNEAKDRGTGNLVTGETLENKKTALHTLDKSTVSQIGTDSVDSITGNEITAAAHAARKGDSIRMTSGAASGSEYRVFSTQTNTILLEEDSLDPLPAATDTFEILRPTSLTLASDGTITTTSGPIQYILDASNQTVTKDTVTPVNNRPLPVELIDTAGKTNQATVVQGTHDNLNANANLQVSDVDLSPANPAPISFGTGVSLPAGTNALGDVRVTNNVTVLQPTHDNFNGNANVQQGDVDVSASNKLHAQSTAADDFLVNANLQVADADNAVGNPVFVNPGTAASFPVEQATHDNLNGNANLQVADVDVSAANPVNVVTEPRTAQTVKQAQITVGTTAVRLTTDAAAPDAKRVRLDFRPDANAAARFFYGSSAVTSGNGLEIFPGESVQFLQDANDYYIISDTAAQTVAVVEVE